MTPHGEDNPSSEEPALKRFYKVVSIEDLDEGFAILLDGRSAKTRKGNLLMGSSRELAQAIAQEWDAQTEGIIFEQMPFTRLQMSINDAGDKERDIWCQSVLNYLDTDLLCYRADRPEGLVIRQSSQWDPLLKDAASNYNVLLNPVIGLVVSEASSDSHRAAYNALHNFSPAQKLAAWRLTDITGSAVLGLLGAGGHLDAHTCATAAMLDELYQAEQWGSDLEAEQRRDAIRAEIVVIFQFLDAAKSES